MLHLSVTILGKQEVDDVMYIRDFPEEMSNQNPIVFKSYDSGVIL